MKAVVLREFGGPDVLSYEDIDDVAPAEDEVVVKVHAVSVNTGLDFGAREGTYSRTVTLPHVLGIDPSGEVLEVGSAVDKSWLGKRVWADFFIGCGACGACSSGNTRGCAENEMLGVDRWGGYADRVVVPARNLEPIPHELGYPEAVVIARHFPLAMYLLEDQAKVRPGEWVMVMGASGGLGNAGVQIAKRNGANVIAGAGSNGRLDFAMETGADFGINYRKDDLAEEILRITEGRGVDVLFENIADPVLWPAAFSTMADNGRVVTAGAHGGGKVELDVKALYLRRVSILGGARVPANGVQRAFDIALQDRVTPGIDRILPLQEAERAHRLVMDGLSIGKVILTPNSVDTT